jgi:hypothetical protein
LSAFLIFPRAGLQPTFHQDTPPLGEVLLAVFSLFAKDHHSVPFGLLNPLAIGTSAVVCGGDA